MTVTSGHAIEEVGYRRTGGPLALGVEAVRTEDVRARLARDPGPRPRRINFHQLVLVTEGEGEHEVDFVAHPCSPGTLLWIRPGQVQRAVLRPALEGWFVRFTPDFPPPMPGADRLVRHPFAPVRHYLDEAARSRFLVIVKQLAEESARPEADPELLRHLLAALILQIRRLPTASDLRSPAGGDIFTGFLCEIERSYATTRRVEDYADRLGYAPKTLTRASLAATGRSAKQVIDARVALEAKRLLAHTDRTVVSIATALGFDEPTNFNKFFTRIVGVTPLRFRERVTAP